MKETDAALASLLRKNLRGPFWSAFTASWLIVNAGFVWALLFQSEQYLFEVYGMTKIDYLSETHYLSPLTDPWPFLLTKVFIPLMLALLFVWGLPHLTHKFLQQSEKTKTEEKRLRERGLRDRIQEEIDTESVRQRLQRIKQTGKDIATQIPLWRKEYDSIRHRYSENREQQPMLGVEWLLTQWRREGQTYINFNRDDVSRKMLHTLQSMDLVEGSMLNSNRYVITNKGVSFVEWLEQDMNHNKSTKSNFTST